jgi:hypothetical protein
MFSFLFLHSAVACRLSWLFKCVTVLPGMRSQLSQPMSTGSGINPSTGIPMEESAHSYPVTIIQEPVFVNEPPGAPLPRVITSSAASRGNVSGQGIMTQSKVIYKVWHFYQMYVIIPCGYRLHQNLAARQ